MIPIVKPFIPPPDELMPALQETLYSGYIAEGQQVYQFEKEFCEFIGNPYCLSLNSGTAALHIALTLIGIEKGDEVISTPLTAEPTNITIKLVGGKVVWADIDPNTGLIDPKSVQEKITSRTKAIMLVHYAGMVCNLNEFNIISREFNVPVIEDAAHAISAEYEGKKIGTIGDVTSFSFYPTKNMTTGEGGMVTTNDEELRERLKIWELHGISKDAWKRYSAEGSWYYEVVCPGYKYNMTDIQASLGLHQLEKLNNFQRKRENIVKDYNDAFKDMKEITIPFVKDNIKHAWHLYVIKIVSEKLKINRNQFIEALRAENIGTSVHFIPAHLQPYYRDTFGFKKGDFPNAEYAFERVISLPLFPKMSNKDVKDVINSVKKIIEYYKK